MNSVDAFKVTAPELTGAIDRERVVDRLRAITTPGKWLCGPSGSGKSTLATQYAAVSGKDLVWYRLDARDDDPAFFYPSYATSRGTARTKAVTLPHFANDDHSDERAFAARYFAALLEARSLPSIFVFDDVHTLSAPARREALARFTAALGGSHEILFISEEPAPTEFYDVVAARCLSLCNDLPLAFDAQECAAMGKALRLAGVDGAELEALTGGHAGALVLACEFLRGAGVDRRRASTVVDRIHQHLLEKLLEGMPAARRDLLLRTAFAPQFGTPLAVALAGENAAAEIDALEARGLLRRIALGTGDAYETHGLIQRGVRASLRAQIGEAKAREIALKTAGLLLAHGHPEDAFALFIEHDSPERAADVLEQLAPQYARSSQAALLSRSAAQIPDTVFDRRPWLCFWVGRTLQGIDEEAARRWFERSYEGCSAAGDTAGMRVAAASVVIAFVIEYGDIRTLDIWLKRHADAGGDRPIEPDCAHESTLCMGVICAAMAAAAYPRGFDTDALVRRLTTLLESPAAWLTPDHPIEAARLLVDHARVFASREQAQHMVLATRKHVELPTASALQRGRWCLSAANAYLLDGKQAAAEDYLQQAHALAEQSGSRRLAFDLAMTRVDAAQKRGDLTAAEAHLKEIEPVTVTAPPAHRAEHARLTARVLLSQGRPMEGLRWADEALQAAGLAGYTGANLRAFQLERIYGLAANRRLDEATQLARQMTADLEGAQFKFGSAIGDCLEFLATGCVNVALLESGLRHAADAGFIHLLSRAGDCLPMVCDFALAHAIQPEFVRRVIATNDLQPPSGAGPHWPWPVRIRTLGSFELDIHGEHYRPSHKAQDKPLELLKLLVCCQSMGRDSADRQWLAERLWPDADDTNARKSLDMTLTRLRRLLRDDGAVTSLDGRLQLSPQRVWTDVAPLLRALTRVGTHRDQHARKRDVEVAAAAADVAAVLEHYRGPFLPEEEAPPWLLASREAVAAAVRSALLTAESLFAGGADEQLIPALERAFNADATSEDLARALMRALSRRKQYSEALRIYRRLREMLSIVLGVGPAEETERVRERIYAEANAGNASSIATSR